MVKLGSGGKRMSNEKRKIRKKEQIRTARLVLKPYETSDRDRLVEFFQNEEIAATFMMPEYPTEEQYFELADKIIGFSQIDNETHLEYGIFLENDLIGMINDCGFDDETIEIGYLIHPDYKGNGYATEALGAILSEAKEMGFQKAVAGFFEENAASRKVMKKCGMHLNQTIEEEEYRGKAHRCLYCEIEL